MRVLVIAVSARMLAELAVADGYDAVALDRFGDVDTRAVAPGATARSNDGLSALGADIEADAVVYGAGFENRPDLVRRMAAGRELLGTPPALLCAVRDPWALAAAARAAGARFPDTRGPHERPEPGLWLRKPRRGGGGRDIRRWRGGRLTPTEILQRRVHGLSCSAVATGDGRRALLLGLTEQLHRSPGFGWMGNVVPPRLPEVELDELGGQLRAVCDEVVARFGTRGAFGVDAVWDGRDAWVLEVNPRPPASLELFGSGCFEAHVRGARGLASPAPLVEPDALRARAGKVPAGPDRRVKLVLFADRHLRAPDPGWWPAGLAHDVPHSGVAIKRGAPVCTLIAADDGPSALIERGRHLLSALPDAVTVGG